MAEPGAVPPDNATQLRAPRRLAPAQGWLAVLMALGIAGWVALSDPLVAGQRWLNAQEPTATTLPAPGPLLLQARERGVLRVGVRAYPRPSLPNDPLPPEPDSYDAGLARHIARQLGVAVQLVGLSPAQAASAASAGKVDLVLAGSPHGAADAQAPLRGTVPYVKGAGRIVVLRKSPLEHPAQLAGRTVCVGEGSPYVQPLRERLGASPVHYRSAVHAISAFMAGECAALAEDEGLLQRLLAQAEWRFYRPLDGSVTPAPSAQVQLAQADPASAQHLDTLLKRWHAQGLEAGARLQRTSEVMLEVALLQDGAICH